MISIASLPQALMEMDYQQIENEKEFLPLILKPSDWLSKLVSLQADITYNCILFLSAPIFSFFSIASDSYHRAEKFLTTVEMSLLQEVPSKLAYGSATMLKKIGFGILGAMQACIIMVFLLVLAAVLGVVLVRMWVEEPLFVREMLFFDYTHPNPEAIFPVAAGKERVPPPVGRVYHVSLLLLMPESEFNQHLGVFQLTAEILSTDGNVMAKSSQPCMLRFRSPLVRQTRTILTGIPILLGISDETQKLTIKIFRYKEGKQRTGAIRVTLSPRAGTSSLPQLYKAEIILNSHLPKTKQLVHDWKWTFYVWTSWYIYVLLLIILISCWRQVLFSVPAPDNLMRDHEPESSSLRNLTLEDLEKPKTWADRYEKEIQDSSGRWQPRGRKRKANLSTPSCA